MNIRIEQAAAPVPHPAGRTPLRLPRGLADARRLAAQALFRGAGGTETASRPLTLVRRGTSCLALAAAALAVPALPSTAFGATSPATPVAAPAAHIRHHLSGAMIFPDPGAVTFESWAVAGWSFSAPDPMVDTRCFSFPHHHRCAPWMYQSAPTVRFPDATADGGWPTVDVVRVSPTSPRAFTDIDAPEPPSVPGEGISTNSTTPTPSVIPFSDLPRSTRPAHQRSEASAAAPSARTRIISTPVTVNTAPATPAASASNQARFGNAAIRPLSSPCFRAAYLAGKDRRMLAHLRPAADAMGVVLNHPHAACAAMVKYLSQTRA